jgi:nitric oxide reductase subunit B
MADASARRKMVVSSTWLQAAVLTFTLGFGVLTYLAWRVNADHPPVPDRAVGPAGDVIFDGEDVREGQQLFERYGLMEYGTIFGHGAYLGPDFNALHIHEVATFLSHQLPGSPADIAARVREIFKENRYRDGVLRLTAPEVAAFDHMQGFYARWFTSPEQQQGLQRPHIADAGELHRLTAFFTWAAWASTALRPGTSHSYTNNWPPDDAAGNRPTADMLLWSALSLVALLAGIGAVLFAFGRWESLGWHRDHDEPGTTLAFRPPEEVKLTPAQRATVWYFLVVAGLFLAQGIMGGANAHYHADPEGFVSLPAATWFPYHLTRTWHVQLALFFVTASYLAMGIFLAPMIAGHEPRGQSVLAVALFVAVVLVVVGSMAGEFLAYHGVLRDLRLSWWLGTQGWEYLDLGRLWQVLLTVGLAAWAALVFRGLRTRLRTEHGGNMPWLFLYATFSIPLFYATGLFFGRTTNFTVIDYWRFWVVHLWVEDFLELFTTITVAFVFVLLGVVREATATRLIYLDVILYSVGGVIGSMHHLYFSGAPAVHMALGAFFSAMEVIPLVLLTYEAWRFMRLGGAGAGDTVIDTSERRFPHRWAVMFLAAVGFWNFVGAGIFGFLINLPIVSYWEIGTQFTANHGHAAMMGVYGMLAVAFFVFVARYFVPEDAGSTRAMRWSFWSLNVGLAWMTLANLFPIGGIQLYDAFAHGYWHARSAEFYATPVVRALEWARLPGDVLFIVGGIGPLVYLALRMVAHRNRPGMVPPEAVAERLTQQAG